MIEMEEITSISFDDESAITASKGLWLFNRNVVQSDEGCMSGRCGFFNSTAESKLELPYFSNAFDRFETFTARLFYKRSPAASGYGNVMSNNCVGGSSRAGSAGAFIAEDGSAIGYLCNSTSYCFIAPTVRIPPVSSLTLFSNRPYICLIICIMLLEINTFFQDCSRNATVE